MNVSHPGKLAHLINSWLDGREITDDPAEPGRAQVLEIRRGDTRSLSYRCSPLSPMNGPSWPPTSATAGNPRRCDYEPGNLPRTQPIHSSRTNATPVRGSA